LPPTPRSRPDNNIAENAIRGISAKKTQLALRRQSIEGGERAAAMYSILQTAKLNVVNPEACLTDILPRIAAGHPINRISEQMAWAYSSQRARPPLEHDQYRTHTFHRALTPAQCIANAMAKT
jgi:hypothetical protein